MNQLQYVQLRCQSSAPKGTPLGAPIQAKTHLPSFPSPHTQQRTNASISAPLSQTRSYQTVDKEFVKSEREALTLTAHDAHTKSCYNNIDWKIPEEAKVIEMLKIMVAKRIGALAVTDEGGKVVGIVSERDYLSKVAFLGKVRTTHVMAS